MGFEVELEIFEAITRGGVRRVSWHVADGEDWVSATACPGAQIERQENGPGTVWVSRVHLQLPAGARLMRVESEPDRQKSEDPLAYLWSGPGVHRRRVRRSYFGVSHKGRLVRLSRPAVTKKP